MPYVSLQIGFAIGSRAFIELGRSAGVYGARGLIPEAMGRDANYRTLIAPEFEAFAAPGIPQATRLALSWCTSSSARAWLRGDVSSASPGRASASESPPSGVRSTRDRKST